MTRTWKCVRSAGNDYDVEVWRAYIRIGGRIHETSYSIRKHGVEGAREKAGRWLARKRARKAFLRSKHLDEMARERLATPHRRER
jgi:hypothetical protein